MAKAKDLYMNFANVLLSYDASNSATLVSAKVDTGLSIRGGLVWLIHFIDFWFANDPSAGHVTQQMALSTVNGLAAMPEITDKGLIERVDLQSFYYTAAGFQYGVGARKKENHLPPIPMASPQVVLYAKTAADITTIRGDAIKCRIGFTTAELDAAMYTEIAEVWGW